MKTKQNLIVISTLIPAMLFLKISSYEKSLYVGTAILFITLLLFKNEYFTLNNISNSNNFSIDLKVQLLLLFVFLLFSQNRFLNIETITWDVSSYLVAANEIDNGFIPMETQWESKGPLTIYIYYFLSNFVESNYVLFKLINDIILFVSIYILFIKLNILDSNKNRHVLIGFFLLSAFSIQWFVSEFTEFYCLPLIAYANYLFLKKEKKYDKYIGFCFGLSFLINQGSILFFIPILIRVLIEKKILKDLVEKTLSFFFGLVLPNLFFIFIYWNKNLLDVYIANYFHIPIGYTGENMSSFYELRVFLREIYNNNEFLYLGIVLLFSFFIINFLKEKKFTFHEHLNLINLNILFSIFYYFIAGHNFYHHLIYFIYFSSFLLIKINQNFQLKLLSLLIILSSFSVLFNSLPSSYSNLTNLTETYENYPLKRAAKIVDSYFVSQDYTVLALDFVLILHYLDKTNYSYIVHPTNHYQKYITDVLIDLDKIEENNIQNLLNNKPDVIICNTMSIDAGGRVMSTDPNTYGNDVKENEIHFCDFSNFSSEYIQIDTESIRKDINLNYYYDPYKEMNIFIKKNF